jgi:hypothetical protein
MVTRCQTNPLSVFIEELITLLYGKLPDPSRVARWLPKSQFLE